MPLSAAALQVAEQHPVCQCHRRRTDAVHCCTQGGPPLQGVPATPFVEEWAGTGGPAQRVGEGPQWVPTAGALVGGNTFVASSFDSTLAESNDILVAMHTARFWQIVVWHMMSANTNNQMLMGIWEKSVGAGAMPQIRRHAMIH